MHPLQIRSTAASERSPLATALITHAMFDEAEDTILESLDDPDGAPIPLLIGAPGFGKTRLLETVANKVAWLHRDEMVADPNFRPVVMMEAQAPIRGNFDWRTGFLTVLAELGEVDVDLRVGTALDQAAALERQTMGRRARGVPELQVDFMAALVARRTQVLFIDEVGHLAYVNDVERYQASLDILKTIANMTGCRIVCAGSYEASGFRLLSGQLIRREREVHLRRYRADVRGEFSEYGRVVAAMLALLEYDGDPAALVPALYRASVGTVGTTRDLLVHADHAARRFGESLVHGLARHLRRDDQSEALAKGILAGEAQFADKPEIRARLDALLGLTDAATPTIPPARPAKRRPGRRTLGRDVVGSPR